MANDSAAFGDRVEVFLNLAWDRGLTVYVSRPNAAAKISAKAAADRSKVISRNEFGDVLFGHGARVWRLSPADHIAAR